MQPAPPGALLAVRAGGVQIYWQCAPAVYKYLLCLTHDQASALPEDARLVSEEDIEREHVRRGDNALSGAVHAGRARCSVRA